jgi:hypothetical protein
MLANNLTLDDEEAVQTEYEALRAELVGTAEPEPTVSLPDAPITSPVTREPESTWKHFTSCNS